MSLPSALPRFMPDPRHWLTFAGFGLLMALLAFGAQYIFATAGPLATVWFCNGVAVAVMLRSPAPYWPALALAVFVGTGTGNSLFGTPVLAAYLLGIANMVEVLVAASVTRTKFGRDSNFDDSAIIGRFLLACLIAASVAALLAATSLHLALGADFLASARGWFVPDVLGLLIITPFLLSFRLGRNRRRSRRRHPGARRRLFDGVRPLATTSLAVSAMIIVTALIFHQPGHPILFLAAPVMTLAAFRLPLFWAMLSLILCSAIAIVMTIMGNGPIAAGEDAVIQTYLLQAFVGSLAALILPVRGLMGERDRFGAAFAASERKFFSIAEASQSGILHVDGNGRPTWNNHRWRALTGRDVSTGRPFEWTRILHEADRPRVELLLGAMRRTGRTTVQEVRGLRDADGHCSWYEISLSPIHSHDHHAPSGEAGEGGYVIRLSDISERRANATALEESEELYRLVTENARDIIFRIGLDGAPLYVSSAARRVLGFEPGELVGISLRDHVHPEDWPLFEGLFTSLGGGEEAELRYRQRCRRGNYLWLEASVRLLSDASGQPLELVATVRDIHQRHEAEMLVVESTARLRESNRLLTLAEGLAQVGHFRIDPANRRFDCSHQLGIMAGLPEDQQLGARAALRLLRTEDRRVVLATLARARREGGVLDCSVRARVGEGEDRHIRLVVQAHQGDGDRASGWFGVARDVTQQVRANAELVGARDRARRAAEAKSNFLATMSHEIRTPMTGVLGMIDLLRSNPAAAEQDQYLDTLKRSADLLMAVLDDILDFSKIESGRLRFEQRDFRMETVAAETIRLFDSAASAKGLVLHYDGPDVPALPVRGDPTRLQQVLSNLLSNAVKFTDKGEIHLRIDARESGDEQHWTIAISDTGVGMSPEEIELLFQPFSQVGEDREAHASGTGLGLAISRRLVEAMGGEIGVESRKGHGSTFRVALKLPVGSEPERLAPAPPAATAPRRALALLVAEDNPVNQMLLNAILRQQGHEVTCVENGRLAVEEAQDRPFDAIIMDMQMPEMDGLAATRAIRASDGPNAHVPIIALTADASPERRRFYDGAGLSLFLTKPIDQDLLNERLNALAAAPRPTGLPASRPAPCLLDAARLDDLAASIGPDAVHGLLDLFGAELGSQALRMRGLQAAGDHDQLSCEAHGLKGAAGNAGAAAIACTAKAIEKATDEATLASLLDQLEGQVAATIAAIGDYQRTRRKSRPA